VTQRIRLRFEKGDAQMTARVTCWNR